MISYEPGLMNFVWDDRPKKPFIARSPIHAALNKLKQIRYVLLDIDIQSANSCLKAIWYSVAIRPAGMN